MAWTTLAPLSLRQRLVLPLLAAPTLLLAPRARANSPARSCSVAFEPFNARLDAGAMWAVRSFAEEMVRWESRLAELLAQAESAEGSPEVALELARQRGAAVAMALRESVLPLLAALRVMPRVVAPPRGNAPLSRESELYRSVLLVDRGRQVVGQPRP